MQLCTAFNAARHVTFRSPVLYRNSVVALACSYTASCAPGVGTGFCTGQRTVILAPLPRSALDEYLQQKVEVLLVHNIDWMQDLFVFVCYLRSLLVGSELPPSFSRYVMLLLQDAIP